VSVVVVSPAEKSAAECKGDSALLRAPTDRAMSDVAVVEVPPTEKSAAEVRVHAAMPAAEELPAGAQEATAKQLLPLTRTPTRGAKSEVALVIAPAEKSAAEVRGGGEVTMPAARLLPADESQRAAVIELLPPAKALTG
jgi:hypothetical protein